MKLKQIGKLTLSLLFVIFVFNACEEEDEPSVTDQGIALSDVSEGELKALMDGDTTVALSAEGTLSADEFEMIVDFPETQTLTITTDTLEATTYNLNGSEAVLVSGTNTYQASEGELIITEVNTTAGTFSGTLNASLLWGEKEIEISSAAFKGISYSIKPTGPENGSFTASVNGEEWAAETMTAQVYTQVDVFDVFGETVNDVDINMYMPADVAEGSTYQLTGNGDYGAAVYMPGETIGTHFSANGELTITKHDTVNNIIEAEFYFDAISQSSEVVYEVRDGIFTYEGYY